VTFQPEIVELKKILLKKYQHDILLKGERQRVNGMHDSNGDFETC
jgi:hypothetical protein